MYVRMPEESIPLGMSKIVTTHANYFVCDTRQTTPTATTITPPEAAEAIHSFEWGINEEKERDLSAIASYVEKLFKLILLFYGIIK